MKLSDFLDIDLLHADISASDARDFLQKMVVTLVRCQAISDEAEAIEKILAREKVMSTGIGGGVAIPHARCASLNRTVLSIALSKEGIDFKALDGNPVHIVFLILGPQDSAALHVKLLAQIAKLIKDRKFVEKLMICRSADEIMRVIRQGEMKEAKENGVE